MPYRETLPGFTLFRTLEGHSEPITAISWAPDGKSVASSSFDGTAIVWDYPSGKRVVKFTGHSSWVTTLTVSPECSSVFSASSDCSVKSWDIKNGEEICTYHGHTDAVWAVAVLPKRQEIVSGGHDRNLILWDLATNQAIKTLPGHKDTILSVAVTSDGQRAFSGSDDGTVRLWDLATGRTLKTLEGHNGPVRSVVLTEEDRHAITASMDGTIRVWDTRTGRQVGTLEGHTAPVGALSVYAAGNLLASASFDDSVRVWRCDSWQEIARLREASPKFPVGLAFHPIEPILATVGERGKKIHLWRFDVDSLYQRHTSNDDIHYSSAKVVLVGQSGTGKTCLARALMGLPFEPQESTHGMKVFNYHSETVRGGDPDRVTREVFLWDLAGQLDYEIVHQLFLDRAALGVVLFDPANSSEPLSGVQHWDRALQKVTSAQCAKLLVAGRIDRGAPPVAREDLDSVIRESQFRSYIQTSAKTGDGVEDLRFAIQDAIPWDKLPVTTSPELWHDLRSHLLNLRTRDEVLIQRLSLRHAFSNANPDVQFSDEEFAAVIHHAQVQGLIWKLSFGDFLLLKPEILNDYASAVVRVARDHPEGLGCVRERDVLDGAVEFRDLQRMEDKAFERSLLHAVVELFLDREIVLRQGEYLVFPSKFNRKHPQHPSPHVSDVAYSFSGPVEQIYATLSVRLAYSGVFELAGLWRNAAEFRYLLGHKCGVLLDYPEEGRGRLLVFFDENSPIETKVLFSQFIHEHLERYALEGSIDRERIYRCEDCGHAVTDQKAVKVRLRNNKATIPCLYCDHHVMLVDSLEARFGEPATITQIQDIERQVAAARRREARATTVKAKTTIGEFDVFLAYNSEDKEKVEIIAKELKTRGLNPWFDKWNLPPGRAFSHEIQRSLPNTKSVAAFIGPSGVGPWQDVELSAALQLFVENKRPVIPILLPGAEVEKNELPLFLRQFAYVRFQKDLQDVEVLDDIEWGITGKHPRRKLVAS